MAIEKDVENVSRYIEFAPGNFATYSIELAKLLISISSEVDVVMKELCNEVDNSKPKNNINDYVNIVTKLIPGFKKEKAYINKFELEFQPWLGWEINNSPEWWKSYNNIKHHRVDFYHEANLGNVLNALSALLITNTYYFRYKLSSNQADLIPFKQVHYKLEYQPDFIRLNKDYYYYSYIG